MSIVKLLGSFPNSQIKPRSPVRESDMIEVSLLADTETLILSEDDTRVRAIIKNKETSAVNVEIRYEVAGDSFTIEPGAAFTVEGGGEDVYAEAIGGVAELEIDNRVG